ncbi:MAG: hypothetical protein ATN36_05840 [Epulopiscium sp. Nele67-Bin005]|nr:MAG: hypothetical protein ATN36_05840 [Epulopiscium sp. Nele67-Bin005]
MFFDTIVVGGGPAGLFAASHIGKSGGSVLLLEKNEQLGKKLLVAGSGQCNFTHDGEISNFFDKYGNKGKFIKKSLLQFDNNYVQQFFNNYGVSNFAREDGKVFPKSLKSMDVLNALIEANKKANVKIQCKSNIEKISLEDELFFIEATQNYSCKNLVIATGGMSYSKLGSNGWGYGIAKQFGHTIIPPKPALTYVETKEKFLTELSGISFQNAEVIIWRDNKKVKQYEGSLLLTHKGVSGPIILNSSRWILPNDKLTFKFDKLVDDALITSKIQNGQKQTISNMLENLEFPKNFVRLMLDYISIDKNTKCAEITKRQRKNIIQFLTSLPLNVNSLGGMHVAMVTAGGVSTKEINPKTFESKKINNLYFIGEVLDIDGDTGGYNIQACFSSGAMCASAISLKQ